MNILPRLFISSTSLIIGLFFLASACSQNSPSTRLELSASESGIVGGSVVNGEEPYSTGMAGIIILDSRGEKIVGVCSGALVSPNTVLTAAHCFPQGKDTKASVVFDLMPLRTYLSLSEIVQQKTIDFTALSSIVAKISNVKQIVIYPSYNERASTSCDFNCKIKEMSQVVPNDLALVQLDKDATAEHTIYKITKPHAEKPSSIIAVGFGLTDPSKQEMDIDIMRSLRLKTDSFSVLMNREDVASHLQEVGYRNSDLNIATDALTTNLVENSQIISVSTNPTHSPLKGDSGSPAFIKDGIQLVIVGVTSRMLSSSPGNPYIMTYSNLLNPEANDWVHRQVDLLKN